MKKTISERVKGNHIKVFRHSITLYNTDGEKSGVITDVTLWNDFQPRHRFEVNEKLNAAGVNRGALFSRDIKYLHIQGENYCLYTGSKPEIIEEARKAFGANLLEPKQVWYTEALFA